MEKQMFPLPNLKEKIMPKGATKMVRESEILIDDLVPSPQSQPRIDEPIAPVELAASVSIDGKRMSRVQTLLFDVTIGAILITTSGLLWMAVSLRNVVGVSVMGVALLTGMAALKITSVREQDSN